MTEEIQQSISVVETQTRFENWANEDMPIVIDPGSFEIDIYAESDLPALSELYMNAFNSQNKRKYKDSPEAVLVWDEDPWSLDSARKQLVEELEAPIGICFVARAETPSGKKEAVGFILARKVDRTSLSEVCGSKEITETIFQTAGENSDLLLWEDAAVFNLRNYQNKTIRGVGESLFRAVGFVADKAGVISIVRTGPGSYTERILSKVGFTTPNPLITDGKDLSRYWSLRFPEVKPE